MKINSYKLLYRIISFFSDKTNGLSILVKYKLLLGTIILTLTSTSCSKKAKVMCYETGPTCYITAPMDSTDVTDTTSTNNPDENINVVCYDYVEMSDSTKQEKR